MKPDPAIAEARQEVERSPRPADAERARSCRTGSAPRPSLATPGAAPRKSAELAEDAVDAVRSRPLAATGVVAAIVTIFLAREPLIDLAGQARRGRRRQTQGHERKKKQRPKPKPRLRHGVSPMTNTDDDTNRSRRRRDQHQPKRPPARHRNLSKAAATRSAGALSEAPLLMLAGGIAAGAVLASLLPGTREETRAVRPFRAPRQGQRQRRLQGRQGYRWRAPRCARHQPRERQRKRSAACSRGLATPRAPRRTPRCQPSRNKD